jgi:hypothetical protein
MAARSNQQKTIHLKPIQALTKLGLEWEPSEAERDYNEGRSTQIPLNPVVRLKGRFSRWLRDGKQELVLAQRAIAPTSRRPKEGELRAINGLNREG